MLLINVLITQSCYILTSKTKPKLNICQFKIKNSLVKNEMIAIFQMIDLNFQMAKNLNMTLSDNGYFLLNINV